MSENNKIIDWETVGQHWYSNIILGDQLKALVAEKLSDDYRTDRFVY